MSLSIPNRSRTLIILSGASSTVVSRLSGWVFGISVIAGLHTVRAGLVEAPFWSLSANMKNGTSTGSVRTEEKSARHRHAEDRKSKRLKSSQQCATRMPSFAWKKKTKNQNIQIKHTESKNKRDNL